jgi:hypothetical protein
MFLSIAFQTACVSKLFSSRQVIDSSPPPGIVFIWTVMLESESIPIVCKNSRQTFTPPPADPVMCLPAAKKVSPVLTATFQNGPKQARVQGETTGSRSVGSNVERASALAIILEQQLAPRLAVFDHDFTHSTHIHRHWPPCLLQSLPLPYQCRSRLLLASNLLPRKQRSRLLLLLLPLIIPTISSGRTRRSRMLRGGRRLSRRILRYISPEERHKTRGGSGHDR